jgi:Macrocin-O-methyltransferase (TylF)
MRSPLQFPRKLLNYARRLRSRLVARWLAKIAPVPPFQFGVTGFWPGTYVAYVPDRYSIYLDAYHRRGGKFDCRYIADFIRGNELNNGGDMPRYFSLVLICDQIAKEGLTGDVAELGVYKGNTAILLVALAGKLESTAYLFDTYEGFATEDLVGIDHDKSHSFTDTTLESVQLLVGNKNVRYMKGYFPTSTYNLPEDLQFCLVHIDCDLLAPTAAALKYFYPRLVKGGFLVMHDYAGLYWNGVEQAIDTFFADKPERLIPIPDKSGTAVIRKI